MTLEEIAQHFYARSQSARTSSHWEHLDQFGPEMFQDTTWLEDFLSRWVSVGFNDTTMQVKDRFALKKAKPLGKIELDQKCLSFDIQKSQSIVRHLQTMFPSADFMSYLGCGVGAPILPVQLEADGKKVNCSFHELSLLYMGMRLRALTYAANLTGPLRLLEIGGGYGGLFEKLVRLMGQQLDVVYLVDLPFNLTIQYWFVDACRKAGLHDLDLIVSPAPGAQYRHAVVFIPVDDQACIGELDVAINARSFGEMLPEDVQRYIDLIQARIRSGGLFYNMNRYEKKNSAGDLLRLKAYPYDDKWLLLNVQLVIFYSGIGELVLLRSDEANPLLRQSLDALPPYMFENGQLAS